MGGAASMGKGRPGPVSTETERKQRGGTRRTGLDTIKHVQSRSREEEKRKGAHKGRQHCSKVEAMIFKIKKRIEKRGMLPAPSFY